jgi:hypothetical protein
MIVLRWQKSSQTPLKIAAIGWLLLLTSKEFGTISAQPKFNQTQSAAP